MDPIAALIQTLGGKSIVGKLVSASLSKLLATPGYSWSRIARETGITRSTLQRGFEKQFLTSRDDTLQRIVNSLSQERFTFTYDDRRTSRAVAVAFPSPMTWGNEFGPRRDGVLPRSLHFISPTPVDDTYRSGLKTELTVSYIPGESAAAMMERYGYDPSSITNIRWVWPEAFR